MNTILNALWLLPALVVGLTVHESAHALAAHWLGDDFPRRQGRLSLNPLRHLSLLGTLALFVIHFGWARPVVVNPYNFRRPRRDMLLTSLAGPAANLLLVGASLAAMQITRRSFLLGADKLLWMYWAHQLLEMAVLLNVILAVLNLLPIPPLDGSRIWPIVLPQMRALLAKKGSMIGTVALVALLWSGGLDPLFRTAVVAAARLTPATDNDRFIDYFTAAQRAEDGTNWQVAEEQYGEALSLWPDSTACLEGRAAVRGWLEKWEPALADLDRKIQLQAANVEDYEYRATLLEQLGRSDEAAAAMKMAEQLRAQEDLPQTQEAEATGPAGG